MSLNGGGGGVGPIIIQIQGDMVVDNEIRASEMAEKMFRLLETHFRRGLTL